MRANNGMSLGTVPMDKLYWYAEHELGMDEDDQRAFVFVMKRADRHFVGTLNERSNKAAANTDKR
jgi:hypothetical protein